MVYKEPTLSSEYRFRGRVINLRIDTIELLQGGKSTREIVEHSGGVGIIPIDDEGNVYMVRQYRRGADCDLLEIPAGKLEEGEQPLTCAIRELEEETGFRAGKMDYMGYFYVSPAYDTEKIHLYLARDLTQGQMHLDDGENLVMEKHELKSLLEMIERGELLDGKTVIALLLVEKSLKND